MALRQAAKQACTARPSLTPVVVPRTACFRPVSSSQRPLGRKAMQVVAVAADLPLELPSQNTPPPPPPEIPTGYHWYETMIILNSSMSDEERDKELAKFEAYMIKEGVQNIQAIVRPRSKMAYPMKGAWEGMYVLYNYAAKRATAKAIQINLSTPEAGSENNVIRHITMCKS